MRAHTRTRTPVYTHTPAKTYTHANTNTNPHESPLASGDKKKKTTQHNATHDAARQQGNPFYVVLFFFFSLYGSGLGTGSAEDVHGHVHVNHRTGRMMPDPRELTDAAVAAAAGVRGLSLGGDAGGVGGNGNGGAMEEEEEEEQFEESEAPPRAVSARFQLTELGPRVTRIHRQAGSPAS